jgi:hypothetical protein
MVERLGFPDEVSGPFTTRKKGGRENGGRSSVYELSEFVAALKAKWRAV